MVFHTSRSCAARKQEFDLAMLIVVWMHLDEEESFFQCSHEPPSG
jgi:hypothetical protein